MAIDPLAFPDPFGIRNPVQAQTPAPLPPLTEPEKQNLLEKIGAAGLGGLSFIGGILNKPGRVIRGALGGHFDELGNVIPFSDALGITDPTREVRGTDILRNLGVHNEKDPSFFSPEGIAGFGLDVATDPLTYVGLGSGALTAAGQAAKKAGTLAPTVAERIALGQGGHIGFGLPGQASAITADLRPVGNAIGAATRALPGGNAIADFAGNAGSAVSGLYNKTIPPLFQSSVLGQTDPIAQQAAREATQAIPGAQAALRERVASLTAKTPEVLAGGAPTQAGGRELRSALETLGAPQGPMAPAVAGQRALQEETLQNLNKMGFPDLPLADPNLAYAPRQAVIAQRETAPLYSKSLKPAGQIPAREEVLKGIPTEGAGSLNDLTRRKDLLPLRDAYAAGQKAPLIDVIDKDYVKLDRNQLNQLRQSGSDPSKLAELEAKAKQAENLADWVSTVPKELAQNDLGFFDRHPHLDLEQSLVRSAPRILKAEALHKSIAGMAELGGEGESLSNVLNKAGLTYRDAAGNSTAMQRTLEAMQNQGKIGKNATLSDLADWTIPYDQADRLAKFTKASTTPAGLKPFLDIYDSITNITKAMQTTLWPANWARNQVQALFQNWVFDSYNAQASGAMKYLKPLVDAKAWREGKVIEGASAYPGLQHLTDEAASQVLQSEIKNYNVATAFKNPEFDILGGDIATRQLIPETAGEARKPFGEILKGYIPKTKSEANPLNVAGFGSSAEDVFAPVKAGRELGQEMHAIDRVSTYLAKRSQGYSPEAALKEVKLAHYDFANMTDFEKSVMKRVMPFYNFARQNIPSVIGELATKPGGKLAQTIRAVEEAKGEHPGFVPPYIGEGIAAPIGQEEDGKQRFLSRIGLGFEDVGRLAGPGGPLGMLNPLIKAPIEQVTGKQLFTGRDLGDLYSPIYQATGQPVGALENLLANSPAGRVYSTARTLADDRKSILDKALNTLTGARITDVDLGQAQRNAVRDYIQANLRGPAVRHFDELSVRPENLPLLSPFEQQLYQLYRSQQARK